MASSWRREGIDANAIDVDVVDGIATLTGDVDHVLANDRALQVAQMIRGVRSVVDRLTVEPRNRSDAAIEQDLNMAFAVNPVVDSWALSAVVKDGAVTLTGTLQSIQEKAAAERIAKSVAGVRDVGNRIEVDYTEHIADAEIKKTIEEFLDWNVKLDGGLITVDVMNGGVTLGGTVGSAYEKQFAARNAWVSGVTAVDVNDLEVLWPLRNKMPRRAAWIALDDDVVRQAIENALARNPLVSPFDLDVTVENGTAKLIGTVGTFEAKRAAAQEARNTVGVWCVENFARTRPIAMTADQRIAQDARDALAADPVTSASDITVLFDDGEAQLHGVVTTEFERKRAEDIVVSVDGIVEVENYLIAYESASTGRTG